MALATTLLSLVALGEISQQTHHWLVHRDGLDVTAVQAGPLDRESYTSPISPGSTSGRSCAHVWGDPAVLVAVGYDPGIPHQGRDDTAIGS